MTCQGGEGYRGGLSDPSDLENFEFVPGEGGVEVRSTGRIPAEALDYVRTTVKRFGRFKTVGTFRGARSVSLYDPPIPSAAGKRSLVYRLRRYYMRERVPAAATLACTYACQLDCVHCSALHHRNGKAPQLTDAQLKKIIDETTDMGCVNIIFTGGEPMLMKSIFDLVGHVDKERATAVMFSNGEYLTKANAEKLREAGLYGVFISMDSPWPEEHDILRRRPGLFRKIEEGIRNMRDAGIIVGFSSYMTHERLGRGGLSRLMDLGRDVGINEITVFDAVPTGALMKTKDLLLTPEDKAEIVSETLRYFKLQQYPTLTAQAHVNSGKSMGCFAAYNQYYMTAYGELCPCDFTPISFGNVAADGVKAVWDRMTNHPLYRKRHQSCRMQDPDFRHRCIDNIPDGERLPYPVELLVDDEGAGKIADGCAVTAAAKALP
jgi:MoaA/NifB/PqqE/SkfB family radical SAM enzyme